MVARKLDPRKRFTKKNERELVKLANDSNMETPEFVEVVSDEVLDELEADTELEDFDREDPAPSVTYVQHTKPEVPEEEGTASPAATFGTLPTSAGAEAATDLAPGAANPADAPADVDAAQAPTTTPDADLDFDGTSDSSVTQKSQILPGAWQ